MGGVSRNARNAHSHRTTNYARCAGLCKELEEDIIARCAQRPPNAHLGYSLTDGKLLQRERPPSANGEEQQRGAHFERAQTRRRSLAHLDQPQLRIHAKIVRVQVG